MSNTQHNEVPDELLGIHALNSFAIYNSSSRGVMFSSHWSQHLVTDQLEDKIIYAGPEQELAKSTLGIRMPKDGRIIRIVQKYPGGAAYGSMAMNPLTTVIYEQADTLELDCFDIPYAVAYHQYFGWRAEAREGLGQLREGAFINEGTVFVDTPGVKDGNSYAYGRNTPVAFMSLPGVGEDGIIVSRSELQNWKYRLYEHRTIEWGSSHYPVHSYGLGKIFPEIGEFIMDDTSLMTLRAYDDDVAPVEMSITDLQQRDNTFDRPTYVRAGKGRVVDIEIIKSNSPSGKLPIGMSDQADRYAQALVRYYKEILQVEERLRMERKKKFGVNKLSTSPRLHKLLVRALAITNHPLKNFRQTLNLQYRKNTIDDYMANFVIEYELTPNKGDKFSNQSGSKGVICEIKEDHEMPVRPDGVRAAMIVDPGPPFHRMSFGQNYEHYMTCAAHDVLARLVVGLGFSKSVHVDDLAAVPHVTQAHLEHIGQKTFDEWYEYLMKFYDTLGNHQAGYFRGLSQEDRYEHICDIINERTLRLNIPASNKKLAKNIVKDMEAQFKPTFGPVEYIGPSGERVSTKENVRIGKIYMFMLEKLADEWSATSTARLQHFGIVSPPTKSEKFVYPFRNSPTRIAGETEFRIFACYVGERGVAEMFDRNNNPVARRAIYWEQLISKTPGRIEKILDRSTIPLGASRPIQIVSHVFACYGIKPTYFDENAS